MAMDGDERIRAIDLRGAQGVQIGDGGIQVNVFARQPEIRRPWMAPMLTGSVVERRSLSTTLLDGLLRASAGATALTTAIEGPGGCGKTTLATQACHDSRVAEHFAGGLLWATVGERSRGGRLAELVGGLCEVISGDGVKTVDPQVAGGRLGDLLDARDPILLVIDDVWRPEQLSPFMIGGRPCHRLITTRNVGVAPRRGISVLVDEMTTEEAIATLTGEVGDIPRDLLVRLVDVTSRWPLLLSLVNAAVLEQLGTGADVRQAVEWVLRRLEAGGPSVLDRDLGDEDSRSQAVEATMNASLSLLEPHERERYLDLAVLPEDTYFPADLLSRLWHQSARLSAAETERVRARLVRLRLVLPGWISGAPAVQLHDILRAYLRHRLTGAELAARHERMVRVAAEMLPHAPEPGPQWWALPGHAEYFWRHLPYHLASTGRVEQSNALVCDLRWVAAKIANLGSSVPAEVDLAEVPTDTAESLQRVLARTTDLLTPGEPPTALGATLYFYLSGVPLLTRIVDAYRHDLAAPQLVPAWLPPDQPGVGILRVLTGHGHGVSQCGFSPDGALLATASHDRTVRLWDVATGQQRKTLTGHTGAVSGCAFSPDGSLLATAGHDLTARVWDVGTGAERRVLAGHSESVMSCAFSPDGALLATASHDWKVQLWEVAAESIRPKHRLPWEYANAFSPDGRRVASVGHDRMVRVWDVTTGDVRQAFDGHTDTVCGCAFSPDGTLIATCGYDRTIRVWDTVAGTQRRLLSGHKDAVSACAFSPDGGLLASASHDDTVRLWDAHTWDLWRTLAGHTGFVSACAFSPDGTRIATASHDHTIRVWDIATGELGRILTGHTDIVTGCTFSPDGMLIASSSHDRTCNVWDAWSGQLRHCLTRHTSGVSDCVFAADGSLVTVDIADRQLRMWRVGSDEPQCGLRTFYPLLRLAWNPSEPLLCGVGEAGIYLFRFLPHGAARAETMHNPVS